MEISGAKLMIAFWGLGAVFLFVVVFSLAYLKFFWRDRFARNLFIFTLFALSILAILKLAIFYFFPYGYIPDRLLFYAVPSPKIIGVWWMLLASGVFILFLKFREKIEQLSVFKFLFLL